MANGIKVGVVTARFNNEVTEKLEEGALSYLESCEGVEVLAVRVPGAVEIPLTCQALFEAGCDGVVALGAVIRGETSHYDYVCSSVERGVTELMLVYNRPIGFGVLTTENEEQALARAGGEHGNKGTDCAQVVMEMIGVLDQIAADSEDFDGYDMEDFAALESGDIEVIGEDSDDEAPKAPRKAAAKKKPAKSSATAQKKKKKARK